MLKKEIYICQMCGKQLKKQSIFGEIRYFTSDNKVICGSCGKSVQTRISELFDKKTYPKTLVNHILHTLERAFLRYQSGCVCESSLSSNQIIQLSNADITAAVEIINKLSDKPINDDELSLYMANANEQKIDCNTKCENPDTYVCPICNKERKRNSFFSAYNYVTTDNKTICGDCKGNVDIRITRLLDSNIYTQSSIDNIRKTYKTLFADTNNINTKLTVFSLEQIINLLKSDANETVDILNNVSKRSLDLIKKSDIYELTDDGEYYIDYQAKCVIMNGKFNYSDILSYEYKENGGLIKKGSSGIAGALLGGAFFGRTGATIGAIVTKNDRVSSEIKTAELTIYIKDGEKVISRTLRYINDPLIPIEKGSKKYNDIYNCAVEVMRHLDAVIKIAEQEIEKEKKEKLEQLAQSFNEISEVKNASKQTTVVQSDDVVAQLRKFKELLDDGVITEEEFSAKKKQLLNIE